MNDQLPSVVQAPPGTNGEAPLMCECGQSIVSFYLIESNKHMCERCAVNEIYKKHESYERIMEKVWNKVKNIMKLRQRVCQSIQHKQTSSDKKSPPIDAQQSEIELNIERLNLFYDLLQIEIEKLRRKSIEEVIINTRKE